MHTYSNVFYSALKEHISISNYLNRVLPKCYSRPDKAIIGFYCSIPRACFISIQREFIYGGR